MIYLCGISINVHVKYVNCRDELTEGTNINNVTLKCDGSKFPVYKYQKKKRPCNVT